MITTETWKNGLTNGLQTTWMLLKIIVPVYAVVTFLSHTAVIPWLANVFSPVMAFTGLPGETALAFVTGAFVSLYAAIGIIAALHLTPFQITTLAVMLNFCHDMPLETAILKKAGVRAWPLVAARFGSAFLVGGLMHQIGKFIG
jgi:spore maturation protein SpmB